MGDTYNPRLSVIQPQIDRLARVLTLVHDALRDEVVPGPVMVPVIGHVIDELEALPDEPIGEVS